MSVIITSVFVMTAAILIRKAFSGKLSGKALMVIWAIVFIKLAIPVSIPASFSVMNLLAGASPAEEKPLTRAEFFADFDEIPAVYMPSETELTDTYADTETVVEYDTEKAAPAKPEKPVIKTSLWETVNTVYVITAAVLTAGVLLAYAVCAVRFGTFEDIAVPEKFAEKGIRFRKGNVGTPAVFGIFRPVILLPFGADVENDPKFEHIILHEKTHIRNRDQLFSLLTLIICCLNWYDPLAWICRALYLKDVEKRCDESVIERIGRANRRAYAESLLACAVERSSPFMLVSGFGENDIKGRIRSMMYDKKFKRGASAAVVALTAVIFAAFGTGASAAAVKNTADDPAAPAAVTEPQKAADTSAAGADIPDPEDLEDEDINYDELFANLPPEEPLTDEIFKEYLASEDAREFSESYARRYLLDPLSFGAVEFSEPFRIPVYFEESENKFEPVIYTWYSAVFRNEKLYALVQLYYTLGYVNLTRVEYLPYDITESINNGNGLSLYIVYAEVNGMSMGEYNNLYYSIDKSGKSTLINKELHLDYELSNPEPLKTTKDDYALISGCNVLSKDMKKIVSAKNRCSSDLRDGSEIMIQNRSEKYLNEEIGQFRYKSIRSYITHLAGEDENGEMMYTLSPISEPDKPVKFAGSEKVYLRMSSGSTEPLYRICPVNKPEKALTLTDGKLKIKKWTGAPEQLWRIMISDLLST